MMDLSHQLHAGRSRRCEGQQCHLIPKTCSSSSPIADRPVKFLTLVGSGNSSLLCFYLRPTISRIFSMSLLCNTPNCGRGRQTPAIGTLQLIFPAVNHTLSTFCRTHNDCGDWNKFVFLLSSLACEVAIWSTSVDEHKSLSIDVVQNDLILYVAQFPSTLTSFDSLSRSNVSAWFEMLEFASVMDTSKGMVLCVVWPAQNVQRNRLLLGDRQNGRYSFIPLHKGPNPRQCMHTWPA